MDAFLLGGGVYVLDWQILPCSCLGNTVGIKKNQTNWDHSFYEIRPLLPEMFPSTTEARPPGKFCFFLTETAKKLGTVASFVPERYQTRQDLAFEQLYLLILLLSEDCR